MNYDDHDPHITFTIEEASHLLEALNVAVASYSKGLSKRPQRQEWIDDWNLLAERLWEFVRSNG